MTRFIPAFLQRRLLRFIVSKIDLIDADAFDLDSLELSWGVWELKDVPLRIDKLRGKIPLPPEIELDHASVHLIKIILPGDLYSSNLTIEVSGVEIQATIRDGAREDEQGKPSDGAFAKPSTYNPRPAVSRAHDHGGEHLGPGGLERLLPTTEDLAQSFLQTEPEEEIQELESAVAAQSQELQASGIFDGGSASSDELGVGAATSLPSFMTDMVKKFLERLQLRITEISVKLVFDQARKNTTTLDEGSLKESAQLLLQIGEVRLDAVDSSITPEEPKFGYRQFSLNEARVYVLGEPEGSFRTSTPSGVSSPVIPTRESTFHSSTASDTKSEASDSTSSPTMSRASWRPTASKDQDMFGSITSSVDDHDESVKAVGSSLLDPAEEQEDVFASMLARRGHLRRQSDATRSTLFHSRHSSTLSVHEDDPAEMSESKLFSHDDAESMYMSAMSAATSTSRAPVPMPGAWSVYEQPSEKKQTLESSIAQATDPSPSNIKENPEIPSRDTKTPEPPSTTTVESPEFSTPTREDTPRPESSHQRKSSGSPLPTHPLLLGTTVVREILVLDRLLCWLPPFFEQSETSDVMTASIPVRGPSAVPPSGPSVRFSAPTRDSLLDVSMTSAAASMHHYRPDTRVEDKTGFENGAIGVEISSIRVDFDLSIAKLMLAISQSIKTTTSQGESPPSTVKDTQPLPPIKLTIGAFEISLLEQVPGFVVPRGALPSTMTVDRASSHVRDLLLGISFKEITLSSSLENLQTEVRLTISRTTISHSTGSILSFSEQRNPALRPPTTSVPSISVISTINDKLLHIDIKTTPVHLSLDLRAIEEILSKAGGISSLLELGGSIASVNTVRGAQPKSAVPKRPRGVGLEQASRSKPSSPSRSLKINVRVASVNFELIGTECTMKIMTSSIKVVQRAEGLGLQIDKVDLAGPFSNAGSNVAPIEISLTNLRMEFLNTPKEVDIDRLLRLITPSKEKYDEDDDIMLDTLLRQRSKGAVLRLTIGSLNGYIDHLDMLAQFSTLVADLSRLSSVTKYLPEDDRPGILALILVKELKVETVINDKIGVIQGNIQSLEVAYINLPSLTAIQLTTFSIKRNADEYLLRPAIPDQHSDMPMLMCRFIAGEMEPTFKTKLFNVLVEYRVPTLVAFLGLGENITEEDLAIGLAASLADLHTMDITHAPTHSSAESDSGTTEPILKGIKIDLGMRNVIIGLNPDQSDAKGLICLTNAGVLAQNPKDADLAIDLIIKKASILIIDDYKTFDSTIFDTTPRALEKDAASVYANAGYVTVGDLSSASVKVLTSHDRELGTSSLDIELRDDLFILETCADSTKTLIGILDGLKPPAPVSKIAKYRTEIVPLQDMLASFSGDAFVSEQGPDNGLRTKSDSESDISDDDAHQDLEYVSEFYDQPLSESRGTLGESHASLSDTVQSLEDSHSSLGDSRDSMADSSGYLGLHGMEGSTGTERARSPASEPSPEEMVASVLNFQDDYFARNSGAGIVPQTQTWAVDKDSGRPKERKYQDFPVKVRVRDVHFIWNLFDGYDWQKTRDTISQAVKDIEVKAAAKRGRVAGHLSPDVDDEEDSVIGDFLFNSIYIGIPAHRDPHELAAQINRGINDDASETGSYATTTTMTSSPSRQGQPRSKRLRLSRSKHHKMTFELSGVSADVLVFPPDSGETQSSIDVRVKDLIIFDHVPTSTWRRFATYMQDAGERESGSSMVHIEILNVKPVPDLAATEMIMKVSVLPLRLHVDQDALDFMTRFFEFKDDSAPTEPEAPSNPPFLQRAEVNAIRLRLDFKPKRVDYAGLRSGRTTEFMNFFILDQADMVLRRVILYGVSGFDRLGIMLNNIWSPDVRRNQLPGVLAGLAPIRSLVNVGAGVKDLVVLPVREYKKDGRIVRSIQKGAVAFAKTTTSELVKLGAKLALGTQTVLQNTETMLGQGDTSRAIDKWDEDEDEEETKKQISLYADQPIGVIQGLRGAYASLERDLLLARDAIVAVPGEVMESGSAGAAARAVLRRAPTVILRPAIGATKAVGQTLLGAGNTLDRENYRRAEEKYKRH